MTHPVENDEERETILRVLSVASFLIFFKSYLVAPLIPSLMLEFHSSVQTTGWLVPAYLLPYGISTLIYGPLSDRIGRRPILLTLLLAMTLASVGTATARTMGQLIAWRAIGGVATGGIIPLGLALVGDLYPYAKRGRALGWMFGAIAGGMAFGSTGGAILNPYIGWRWLFVIVGIATAVLFVPAWRHRRLLDVARDPNPARIQIIVHRYIELLRDPRGSRAYAFVTLNGMFHAGLFAWLGLYFSQRYQLGDRGIGLALIGYGLPGLLLGPFIGRMADRFGRNRIIPIGIILSAGCAAALALPAPLWLPTIIVALLSLGLDMSHPLLAGIVTTLDPSRRGQALGLNAFALFTGFGLGALLFQALLMANFNTALLAFAAGQLLAGLAAFKIFANEMATSATMRG